MLFVLAVAPWATCGTVSAATVTIDDPSFENTVIGDGLSSAPTTSWVVATGVPIFDPINVFFAGTDGDGARWGRP